VKSFFLDSEAWPTTLTAGDMVLLSGAEAHHLLHVLRASDNDIVRLFDGCGREGSFALKDRNKREARLECIEARLLARPQPETVLALGWTKALRRSWLLEKAVEFEAAGLWFWQARRSQGDVPAESKETWQAQLIAGAKQCGNPWLPAVRTLPRGAAELAAASPDFDRRFVLWENPDIPRRLELQDLAPLAAGRTLFVLGPEGGFGDEEIHTLDRAGFTSLSLGDRVLRWETAALLCLGLAWWARQGARR